MGACPPCSGTAAFSIFISLFSIVLTAILPASPTHELTLADFNSQNDADDLSSLSIRMEQLKAERMQHLLNLRKIIDDMSRVATAPIPDKPQIFFSSLKTPSLDSAGIVSKRVFCNNYGGCGGRFRGRRRQKLQRSVGKRWSPNVKRPFCNINGCFNGGKRTSPPPVTEESLNLLENEDFAMHVKRVFCNSYGGCRNFGKRLTLPARPETQNLDTTGDDARFLDFEKDRHESVHDILKRFLNGGFDKNMKKMLANMKKQKG